MKPKLLFSMGLPLSQHRYKHYDFEAEPGCTTAAEYSIEMAQFEASETTQTHPANYICRTCKTWGHKQKHCSRYQCRICGKYAPKHLTAFCPILKGQKLLRRGRSSDKFHSELLKLEAAFDHQRALVAEERAENELDAIALLADIDVDPIYYANQDD